MAKPHPSDHFDPSQPVAVRPARPGDAPAIVELVAALAAYEGGADLVRLDTERLEAALFCDSPMVFAHVAQASREIVGMAVWFVNYSTWAATHGIYLEDLFVRPAWRGSGAGRALLRELARIAVARGYTRIDWAVLDWNQLALGFYLHLGARPLDEWTSYRLSGPDLLRLADG